MGRAINERSVTKSALDWLNIAGYPDMTEYLEKCRPISVVFDSIWFTKMETSSRISKILGDKLDKALATVLVTTSADQRYFIGEALLTGASLYLFSRYAGVYLDRLGFKAVAERLADSTLKFSMKSAPKR